MDNRFYSDKKSHSGFREDRSFVGVQWYRVRAHQKQAGEFPTLAAKVLKSRSLLKFQRLGSSPKVTCLPYPITVAGFFYSEDFR